MNISGNNYTDDNGVCLRTVYEIVSEEENQQITASIDLKKLKTDPSRSHAVLDRVIDRKTNKTEKIFEIHETYVFFTATMDSIIDTPA